MPLARWHALCLDAADPQRLGSFWATVLGGELAAVADGSVRIDGVPGGAVWVDPVPEPRTVKNRVHLDVRARSLQPLLDAGARVLRPEGDGGTGWTVLADPEGGEFCAFLRDELPADPPARLYELVVDTADSASSQALAQWWADVLGGRSVDDGRGFWWVEDVPGLPFESIDVVPVPEPKRAKNRVHWDVTTDDVPGLLARGAALLRAPDDEIGWHVLADPQGDEFCADAPDAEGAP